MALEPITRQEQIVAGKALEPITRMEKFLKQYGGGAGGGGGGEQYIRINTDYDGVAHCNMSYEEVCKLCFSEPVLPVMGVCVASNGANCYLTNADDVRDALPVGYVRLGFQNLSNSSDLPDWYYLADGTLTNIRPGGK